MIKLIALDLDGTLLRKDKSISPRTQQALQSAHAQGIEIVLASGRPTVGIEPIWAQLDIDAPPNYMISFNGSLSTHLPSKSTLLSKGLNGRDVKKLKSIIEKIGLNIHAFSESLGLIAPALNPYTEREAEINGIEITLLDFDELDDDHPIIKVMMVGESTALDAGEKLLPPELMQTYTQVRSASIFFEFLNPDVNKGIALEAIAKHKGISMDEVISFGDAGNDRAMLKLSGKGVAMANADAETKEIADLMTTSNEDDGIALILEPLLAQ
jgi:Cof subfamily protein (haloacid dehalogenase superfamily)